MELLCSDLSGQKKHGIIYGMGSVPFGTLRFSHGEGHVLYCAERNSRAAQYFDVDLEWDNDEKILESKVGKKFELCDSWGEACFDVKRPVLCYADVSSGSVTVLDQIPIGISPAFAIWAPNDEGIVFFGLDDEPFKIGKIYCNNRKGSIYYYEFSSAKLQLIGTKNIAAESPSFSLDGKSLVYFQRPADGPHQAVMEMVSELISIDVTTGQVAKLTNHGIFFHLIPTAYFLNDCYFSERHEIYVLKVIISFSLRNKCYNLFLFCLWPRRDITCLLNSGFAVLMVNFHGSVGFGDKFLRSLPGHCGDMDVKDVHVSIQLLLYKTNTRFLQKF
uniref:APEH_N domain-containing protein n=1 Tax=Heterorhabditis bacteriophora TaxID=37862 RepID=A0A1I7XA72_HETBA